MYLTLRREQNQDRLCELNSSKRCFQWRSEVRGQTEWGCRADLGSGSFSLGWSSDGCFCWRRSVTRGNSHQFHRNTSLVCLLRKQELHMWEERLARVHSLQICWKSRNETTAVPPDPWRCKMRWTISTNGRSSSVCMCFVWRKMHVPYCKWFCDVILRDSFNQILMKQNKSTFILIEYYYSKIINVLWPYIR